MPCRAVGPSWGWRWHRRRRVHRPRCRPRPAGRPARRGARRGARRLRRRVLLPRGRGVGVRRGGHRPAARAGTTCPSGWADRPRSALQPGGRRGATAGCRRARPTAGCPPASPTYASLLEEAGRVRRAVHRRGADRAPLYVGEPRWDVGRAVHGSPEQVAGLPPGAGGAGRRPDRGGVPQPRRPRALRPDPRVRRRGGPARGLTVRSDQPEPAVDGDDLARSRSWPRRTAGSTSPRPPPSPVPCRPSGTGVRPRDGRPCVALRPIGVSMRPGATTFERTPRRAPSRATWRLSPMMPGLRRVVGGEPAAGPEPGHRADEDERAALGHVRRRGLRHEEVAAQVDGEHCVPVLGRRAGSRPRAPADADVEHHAVQGGPPPASTAVGHQGGAGVLVADVGRPPRRRRPPSARTRAARRLGAGRVAVGAHDPGPGAGRGHGDGAAVADGGVLVVAGLRAGADDERRCGPPVRPSRLLASSSTWTPRLFRANATMW